jgi:hypothetical protein
VSGSHGPRRRHLGAAGTLAAATALLSCAAEDSDLTPQPGATPTASSTGRPNGSTVVTSTAHDDALAGFGLPVPEGWTVRRRAVVGTELQTAATACLAVEVVDSPEAGAPSVDHAVVQICAVPRADDRSLGEWLRGRGSTEWTTTSFGSCRVLEVPGGRERRLAYAQTVGRRAEIAIVVATTRKATEERRAEVAALLDEMQCPNG